MQYLLTIEFYSKNIVRAVKKLRQQQKYHDLGIAILTNNPSKYAKFHDDEVPITVVACSFSDSDIRAAMGLLKDSIVAVTCHGEKQVQYLRLTVPFLPQGVLVASELALRISTNKRLMRAAFLESYPEISPQFLAVHTADNQTIDEIEAKLRYPVIVKPASLASSLLIQSCTNRNELMSALQGIFEHIGGVYRKEGRTEASEVIVEEYLEGDFYSIDAYVLDEGQEFFCPPVRYIPAKQMGIDDFFLYKRFVPAQLSEKEIQGANSACAKAILAVGLTYSAAHIELVRTNEGWKIIEIGPRPGRFRDAMYRTAYGIDHTLNQILVHLGEHPVIPTTLQTYCAAYSIYPYNEGTLASISGLEELADHKDVVRLQQYGRRGDVCLFAKNGGKALAEIVISCKNEQDYSRLTEYIEQHVRAEITT